MKIEIFDFDPGQWQKVKNAAMNTIGKESGKFPDEKWKRKMLAAEHSPIRLLEFTIRMIDIPYWVSVHLVRHNVGVTHFVSTQRTDRTGEDRNTKTQDALVSHTMVANAQALINISRKRLCAQSAKETRAVWNAVREAVREVAPEVADAMVPDCIYRGRCMDISCCGYYHNTDKFLDDLVRYRQAMRPDG